MDKETLSKFIEKFPELCIECWACQGTGQVRKLGTLTWLECSECHQLRKLPDIIKMVEYLLGTDKPKKGDGN